MVLSKVGAVAVFASVAVAACASHSQHTAKPAAAHAPRNHETARATLKRYLALSFKEAHRSAWTLLTKKDRTRWSRATYVRQEQANDELRDRVRALGKETYHIVSMRERGQRARAVVTVTNGLGTDRLRFLLRKEGGKWRIDYGESWSNAD